ncbi:hypothetical protein JB92DRAFT_1037553 [Gautieria morchelliformis]|nr:hypothetical protein JB92DRAFT_1037553 [Gautieria morchelliformis]
MSESTPGNALHLALARSAYSLFPGPSDPSGTILPHQPLPRSMFGEVRPTRASSGRQTHLAAGRLADNPRDVGPDFLMMCTNILRPTIVSVAKYILKWRCLAAHGAKGQTLCGATTGRIVARCSLSASIRCHHSGSLVPVGDSHSW